MTKEQRVAYNRKRSNIISALRRKNIEEFTHLTDYMNKNHHRHTPEELSALSRLRKNIISCGAHSLYAESDGGLTFIGTHTCDNKNCHICNYNRKKRIRRKLLRWFTDNPTLIRLKDKDKVVTHTQYSEKHNGAAYEEVKYDLMHLTLTVPHPGGKWNGQEFYYKEIMEAFNVMRKDKLIKQYIYGGEFGVETTRNENGLHIHIHSLLLVKKETQNRNKLHRLILLRWNKLTADPTVEAQPFTAERIKAMKKGNTLLTDEDIAQLNPQGATMIGLENIYTQNGDKKQRISDITGKEVMPAILETVSYHFKPLALETDGHLDYALIAKISAAIYKRPLYKKFGCWHGEKSLNIRGGNTVEGVLEDYADSVEVIKDEETGVLIDGETGEIIEAGYSAYYMTDAAGVFHIKEENYKIVFSRAAKRKLKRLPALSTAEALAMMLDDSIRDIMQQKQDEHKIVTH